MHYPKNSSGVGFLPSKRFVIIMKLLRNIKVFFFVPSYSFLESPLLLLHKVVHRFFLIGRIPGVSLLELPPIVWRNNARQWIKKTRSNAYE